MTKTIVCPACDGAGWSGTKICERCHGTGNVKRPMTNGDRIRSMIDEKLAAIIMCPFDADPDMCRVPLTCYRCCLGWLRRIAEEDA